MRQRITLPDIIILDSLLRGLVRLLTCNNSFFQPELDNHICSSPHFNLIKLNNLYCSSLCFQIQTLQQEETEKKEQFKQQIIAYFKINFDYMLLDILIYIVFAICVVIVVYGQVSPHAYWHHEAVKHLVTEGQYGGLSIDEASP